MRAKYGQSTYFLQQFLGNPKQQYKISLKKYNFIIRYPITCGLISEMPIFLPEIQNKNKLWGHYPTPYFLLGTFLGLTGRKWCYF